MLRNSGIAVSQKTKPSDSYQEGLALSAAVQINSWEKTHFSQHLQAAEVAQRLALAGLHTSPQLQHW